MDYRFTDLVDIEAFRSILESLYEATGIMHGLVDAENSVISAVGWQEACTEFHRAFPISTERCLQSNCELAEQLGSKQPFVGGICKNGLMDYVCPIVIEGRQMATLYFGQILHEPPDMDFFGRQAQECGFDEEAYLKAISKVPVVPRERIEPIMAFFSQLAQLLAQSGLDRINTRKAGQELAELNQDLAQRVTERTEELARKNQQLAADITLRQETEEALRDSRAQLQAILDSSPTGIGWSRDGQVDYTNKKFTELFGYQGEDILTLENWSQLAFPDETFRKQFFEPWSRKVDAAKDTGITVQPLEAPVVCKDGSIRYVMISASWIGEHRLVNFSDITKRWHAERRNQTRNTVLELIAQGASLTETLNALVLSVEAEGLDMLCSILLLDREGRHLHNGAAPNLPEFYNEAIDGVEIGMGVGSCGTVAFTQQRVVVSDIQSHAYWTNFKELASRAGLAACWSEPIFSSKRRLLGTFAIYHSQPKSPTNDELTLIEQSANLASIAIEHFQVLDELERRAHTDSLTDLANRGRFMELAEAELARAKRYGSPLAIMLLDVDNFKAVNDKHGHKAGDIVLQSLAAILRKTLRVVDIIGRIGGEEFAVLLPETDTVEAPEVAERLRQAISNTQIAVSDSKLLSISASIGVAIPKVISNDIDNILHQADVALYEAKNGGRDRVCVANAS